MDRITDVYEQLQNKEDIILGGIVGSFNFKLNDNLSDRDMRFYLMPSLDDLVRNRVPRQLILYKDNDIQMHDIRRFLYFVRMGDANMISILFSDEMVVNPKFQEFVNLLVSRREEIAEASQGAIGAWGSSMFNKKMGLLHYYKENELFYEQYGYNTKAACQAFYHIKFINKYLSNLHYNVDEPFKKAIDCSEIREQVLDIKSGAYTESAFMDLANEEFEVYDHSPKDVCSNLGWLSTEVHEAVKRSVV